MENQTDHPAVDLAIDRRDSNVLSHTIQPYGFLLGLSTTDCKIVMVSNNLEGLFGAPVASLIGKQVRDLPFRLKPQVLLSLLNASPEDRVGRHRHVLTKDRLGNRFHVVAHTGPTFAALEIEPVAESPLSEAQLARLSRVVVTELAESTVVEKVANAVASAIRGATAFERVAVCKLNTDLKATVIGESTATDDVCRVGREMPAFALTEQERELFARGWVLNMPDAQAPAVSLVPGAAWQDLAECNLTRCHMLSLSAERLSQLKRRAVAASLAVPLIVNGELWGLIVCDHPSPRLTDFTVRRFCTQLARLLSQWVADHEFQVLNETRAQERMMLMAERQMLMETIAHDLKVPILGSNRITELLLGGAAGKLDNQQRELLQKLHLSNKTLLGTVQNMLDLYRWETGSEDPEMERTDLRVVMTAVKESMEPLCEAKKLKTTWLMPAHPVWVDGDKTMLVRLLENLVSNAFKYSPEGGSVEVSATSTAHGEVLEVADRGLGMTAAEIERMFGQGGANGQSYASPDRKTGLGLKVCRHVVSAHGAQIGCQSQAGRGTRIRVIFPRAVECE